MRLDPPAGHVPAADPPDAPTARPGPDAGRGASAPEWRPPADWVRVRTVDAHAAGEPLRVIVDGFPLPEGRTILERRRWAREHLDGYRRALMWEPRGHADMYGALPVPPERADGDVGVLFLHNEGYSTMCGHGIIALATVLLQTGMQPAREPHTTLRIDTPAGRVTAVADVREGRVPTVRFRNVPAYVVELDARVGVAGLGEVRYDLAFGGAYYAFVDAESVGLELTPAAGGRLIEVGMAIKRAVVAARAIEHPEQPDLGYLYGTIFVGPPAERGHHSRNVCIFAEGQLDRSPTGTGVSARAAIHHARGELAAHEPIVIESILGTTFAVRVVETVRLGSHDAVVPEVAGRAFVTGRNEWLLDPDDPLRHGFLLR